ncbi:MAG TPA: MlaD family protein [Thermoleophilaceae bacterium]|nr:MlaD family protein [Thermoleophilaceae bacterium]
MIKVAPSLSRIAAMVAFAMSCFAIVLFLWIQFGGATPLKPERYIVEAAFPEAVGLLPDVDVRAAGITIGTVRSVEPERATGRALARLALEPRYAPLASDARAILRRKTLLGETFVEITTGSRDAPRLRDGGRIADAAVAGTVELDEVFQTWDPETRRAFRIWQQQLGAAVGARGESLNNALGALPGFVESGGDLLQLLDEQETAVRGLVRDTGHVYEALTRDEAQLEALVRNSHDLFGQTAAERESLAEAFAIFPTFLTESRLTLNRLEGFARRARPVVRDLRPVARELRPTVRAARALAPDLDRFFVGLDRQIAASHAGLPALADVLEATRPTLGALGPFLGELNPIFEWLEQNQHLVGDFLGYAAGGLADTIPSAPEGEVGHYLRQLGVTGLDSLGIHRSRLSSNRGNSYLPPVIPSEETSRRLALPAWDCKPSGGEVRSEVRPGAGSVVACWVAPLIPFKGVERAFPHVEAESYR